MDWPDINAKNRRSVVNKPSSGRAPTPAPIAAHHQTGNYSPINNRRPSIRGLHSIAPLHPRTKSRSTTPHTVLPHSEQHNGLAPHSTVLMWSRGTTRNDCTPHWATGHRRTWRTSTIDDKRHKPSHSRDGKNQVTSLIFFAISRDGWRLSRRHGRRPSRRSRWTTSCSHPSSPAPSAANCDPSLSCSICSICSISYHI